MILWTFELLGADVLENIRAELRSAEWEDGVVSAKAVAPGVKNNLQAKSSPGVVECQKIILEAIKTSRAFSAYVLPAQVTTVLFSKYELGMTYGRHVDSPVMGGSVRTDLAATVFLSYPVDYEGGELEVDEAPILKLPAGHVVVYPADRIHRVTPVTRGERLAGIFWVQSRVQNERNREILRELYDSAAWAESIAPGSEEALRIHRTRSELLRRWMNP